MIQCQSVCARAPFWALARRRIGRWPGVGYTTWPGAGRAGRAPAGRRFGRRPGWPERGIKGVGCPMVRGYPYSLIGNHEHDG